MDNYSLKNSKCVSKLWVPLIKAIKIIVALQPSEQNKILPPERVIKTHIGIGLQRNPCDFAWSHCGNYGEVVRFSGKGKFQGVIQQRLVAQNVNVERCRQVSVCQKTPGFCEGCGCRRLATASATALRAGVELAWTKKTSMHCTCLYLSYTMILKSQF